MLGRNRYDRDDRRGGGRGRDGMLGCVSRYSPNMLFLGSQESLPRFIMIHPIIQLLDIPFHHLGGGNSNIFGIFTPILGEDSNFDEYYHQN